MATKNNKKVVVTEPPTTEKSWKFQKGNVSLAFSLRIDIKQDMKDFKELMQVAIQTIDKQLEETK